MLKNYQNVVPFKLTENVNLTANTDKFSVGKSVSFECKYYLKSSDQLQTIAYYKEGIDEFNPFYFLHNTGEKFSSSQIKGVQYVTNDKLDKTNMILSLTVFNTTLDTEGSYMCQIFYINGTYVSPGVFQLYSVKSKTIQIKNNCYQTNVSIITIAILSLILWFNQ
ncbi:uncharacterized protein LOC128960206 [Oppia nitens]|uniref:uncharacterized protein LOC128960206 n=1 Tax=Oppia nitens TaxID=1686743 RepID=UPI0023D9E5D2|nr:uncharacterized protein LOC128960206 [Oppia nitens]